MNTKWVWSFVALAAGAITITSTSQAAERAVVKSAKTAAVPANEKTAFFGCNPCGYGYGYGGGCGYGGGYYGGCSYPSYGYGCTTICSPRPVCRPYGGCYGGGFYGGYGSPVISGPIYSDPYGLPGYSAPGYSAPGYGYGYPVYGQAKATSKYKTSRPNFDRFDGRDNSPFFE